MSPLDLIDQAFQPIVILLGFYLVIEFRAIAQNISALNTNMAVLIERTTSQKTEIERLESRLQFVESKLS